MSWRRNDGQTGANTIPLGNRRRFGAEDGGTPEYNSPASHGEKRGRSPEPRQESRFNPDGTRKRKKKQRWGDASDNKAAGLVDMPTSVEMALTGEQAEAYMIHMRIEEISQKLRINDVVPADGNRSPSPPPQYDNQGKRVNTREYRYRKKLEDERHKLIEGAMKTVPGYKPPHDYRRPIKTQEKVYVPVNDYPEINFIGLLIGPRGNTLKNMERESGAKIAIRGKGSVKEGKGKSDAAHASNQDEDLHCLIIADTEEKINKAKKLVHNVIETAASIPEGQNELKRHQLRELAALNGTLRDDENQACQNCGEIGHRKYDCPNARNYTASITCRNCGGAGHIQRDCPDRVRGQDWRNSGPPRRAVENMADNDYDRLMNEIESGGAPAKQIGWQEGGAPGGDSHSSLPPWQRGGGGGGGGGGGAAPWRNQQQSSGGAAPWRNQQQDNNYDNGYGGGGYGGGGHGGRGGYDHGSSGGPPPWQQNRDAPPWQQQNNNYGGSHGGYNNNVPPPPPPPPPGSGGPPWSQHNGADVPPPPPPA